MPAGLTAMNKSLGAVAYLQWLLQQIDDPLRGEELAGQWAELLRRAVKRYTAGESTSVPVERARVLSECTSYTVGLYLKSLRDDRQALTILQREPAAEMYQQGRRVLQQQTHLGQKLLHMAQQTALAVDNWAYQDTLTKALPLFFARYDRAFAAAETPVLVDYPLYVWSERFSGIEWVNDYLRRLIVENDFCRHFHILELQELLEAYASDWQEQLINIFSLALGNNLALALLGRGEEGTLLVTEGQLNKLSSLCSGWGKADFETHLSRCAQKLSRGYHLQPAVEQYVLQAVPALAVRLSAALEQGELGVWLVCR